MFAAGCVSLSSLYVHAAGPSEGFLDGEFGLLNQLQFAEEEGFLEPGYVENLPVFTKTFTPEEGPDLTAYLLTQFDVDVPQGNAAVTYNFYSLSGPGATYENVRSILYNQPWFAGNDFSLLAGSDELAIAQGLDINSIVRNELEIIFTDEWDGNSSGGVEGFVVVADENNGTRVFYESDGVGNFQNYPGGIQQLTYWNDLIESGEVYWLLGYIQSALGPSAEDTLASMQANAFTLKNAFNRQYSQLAYGLDHDCNTFDEKNLCVTVFGRKISMDDSDYDSGSAGLILAYKPDPQFRIGAYADKSFSGKTTNGLELKAQIPDFGAFVVWNQQLDGTGLKLRAAANYGKHNINITRIVDEGSSAEAGEGKTDMVGYGALLEASFTMNFNEMWSAQTYAGLRYLSLNRESYSESTTEDVANPLSYLALSQETTSATVGVRLNNQITPKLTASLNAGIEYDINHNIDDYHATGVDDLGSIDMDSQTDVTRPAAGLGLSYNMNKQQRISVAVQHRKEIFMSESSTTGQLAYIMSF